MVPIHMRNFHLILADVTDQEVGSSPPGVDDFSYERGVNSHVKEGSLFNEDGNYGGIQQKWTVPAYWASYEQRLHSSLLVLAPPIFLLLYNFRRTPKY